MVSSCGPDVRAPFSLSLTLPVLDWRLAMQGFIFCQHVQANTRRPLLIGTDSLSGKIQPSPSEPSAPRWVEIFCRLLQEVKEQGGGKEEQKKKRATRSWGWSQGPLLNNGPCVYMRRIISDKAILAPLSPRAPLLLPLPLLFLYFLFVFALRGLCPDERQSR